MADISQMEQAPVVKSNGDYAPRILAFRVTTNASGDMTLDPGSDREGAFSAPARSGLVYTVNVGSFKYCHGIFTSFGTGFFSAKAYNAAAGTLTLTANATLANTFGDFIIALDRGVF